MHQECTHNRVFIRTLLQKPLVIQALEWLMIESLHCFAFDCKTIWKWMKSIKDVTWILVKLLSLFGQSHPPIPATCQHETLQHRVERSRASRSSTPFSSSTGWARATLLPYIYSFLQGEWGGVGVCGRWCSAQVIAREIKRRSTSQGIWWLRKESWCPHPESDSLITVERMNLKGAGEENLCLPATS